MLIFFFIVSISRYVSSYITITAATNTLICNTYLKKYIESKKKCFSNEYLDILWHVFRSWFTLNIIEVMQTVNHKNIDVAIEQYAKPKSLNAKIMSYNYQNAFIAVVVVVLTTIYKRYHHSIFKSQRLSACQIYVTTEFLSLTAIRCKIL